MYPCVYKINIFPKVKSNQNVKKLIKFEYSYSYQIGSYYMFKRICNDFHLRRYLLMSIR